MIRGPNLLGAPELSFNTRPASAAHLLLAHATDTHMDPVRSEMRARVSPCARGTSQALLPVAASLGKASRGYSCALCRVHRRAWKDSATVVLSY